MPVTSYSTTAASNNSAPPNGAPEGMSPSSVNDTIRQIMADVAVEAQRNAVKYLGSVAGTNTITGSMSPALASYSAGMIVVFTPANNNTGATTLNINSLGALDVLKENGDALGAGDLMAGIPAVLVLDSGADDWTLLNPIFKGMPALASSGNYTLTIADAGKHLTHPSGGGAGDTFTIPANSSVPFPVGTFVTFVNLDSNSLSIAITTDTLTLAGTTSTGTRTLAQNSIATAFKIESTSWLISGPGLT